MDQDQPKRIRRYASTFGILILLAAVLGFYYFKYVPERRTEYNKAAFLELNQIEHALRNQDDAYHNALQNIISHGKVDFGAYSNFNLQPTGYLNFGDSDDVRSGRFNFIDEMGVWQLVYPVSDQSQKSQLYELSKDADSLMRSIVYTYKDIFDDYLLIDDEHDLDGEYDKGKVIFESGDLFMNDSVGTDSLLKKHGGFNLDNLQDVTIGGNAYKLFLYKFELGSQHLILAGLISDSNYREANLKIPFSFFSVFIVIVLLLIIHLPILRIYILGPNERIRERDIRLIIGSFFVAAFFGFFIFTKIFLNKEEADYNKRNINTISCKIIKNFQTELGMMTRQLGSFDSTLECMRRESDNVKLLNENDSSSIKSMSSTPIDNSTVLFLDSLFKPFIYPYPNNVFWINSNGNTVARWGFKKTLTNSPLINVEDRSYYIDFKNNEPLSIKGVDDSITIQPTLSKLEGDYVVNVAKRSNVQPYKVRVSLPNQKTDQRKDTILEVKPFVIGISTEMHSVYNVVMPPGYNFSIIDESGAILYDNRPGRPMLSNIFKETENYERIQQSALYRNTRYFENIRLRSKDMALLSRPIEGTPNQLLVYYNKARSDEFQEHLIILSSVLIGAVICLVIFTSLINRWSKDKNRMLDSRSHHFEWLYPSDDFFKQKYYLHLIRGMLFLLAVYLAVWVVLELLTSRAEFSFLFVSLLFPFYIAVFYYELRERYYDVQEMRTDVNWYFARPSLALRVSLLIIIILINCCISFGHAFWRFAWPVFFTQLIWIVMIMLLTIRFRHYIMMEKNPSDTDSKVCDDLKKGDHPEDKMVLPVARSFWARLLELIQSVIFFIATYEFRKDRTITNIPVSNIRMGMTDKSGKPESTYKIPTKFIWSILIGVTLVSIVPAFGLFMMFFHQEKALYQHTDELIMSKEINQRAGTINEKIKKFKYQIINQTDQSNISKLKFSEGIYLIDGRVTTDSVKTTSLRLAYPAKQYIGLHDQVFPEDSLVLDWTTPTNKASDTSWSFVNETEDRSHEPELLINKRKDGINPGEFRILSSPYANCNTSSHIGHCFSGMGTAFCIFFIVGLCFGLTIAYILTLSLARRIFLVELQQVVGQVDYSNNYASKLYKQRGIQSEMKTMILHNLKEINSRSGNLSLNQIETDDSWNPELDDVYHFEKKLPLYRLEALMPSLIDTLEPAYYNLWSKLSPQHKFILFDFAQDGFANYKAGRDLQALIEKGLLVFDGQRLRVMTLSFQEYILQQKDDPELTTCLVKAKKENTWNKIQTPLLILLLAAGIFIFATQEEVYKKITGLLATVTSLLPLLTSMFGKSSVKSAES